MEGRRIDNAINNYNAFLKKQGNKSTKGSFYITDYFRIRERNETSEGISLYPVIGDALKAGFWIGYQCAKREARTRHSR